MDEDDMLISPPKPLNESQLEVVDLHKLLTDCWRRNSFSKVGLTDRLPFSDRGHSAHYSALVSEDLDLDSELKVFLESGDSSMIPDELLSMNNMEPVSHHFENDRSSNQKISAKLKNMEMKENDFKQDESEALARDKTEVESLFNETDDNVGDYEYSFCEDEEGDHESEYNL